MNQHLEVQVEVTQEKESGIMVWFIIGICTGLIFFIVVGTKIGNRFQQKQLQELYSK